MTQQERDELLNKKIDLTTTIREALATQFMSWCLKKVNGLQAFNSAVSEITNLANMYPGRVMDDDKKIEILQKLIALGVVIEP